MTVIARSAADADALATALFIMKPEEGIARVALGLGKTVVEGETSLRFSPAYPQFLPQFSANAAGLLFVDAVRYRSHEPDGACNQAGPGFERYEKVEPGWFASGCGRLAEPS